MYGESIYNDDSLSELRYPFDSFILFLPDHQSKRDNLDYLIIYLLYNVELFYYSPTMLEKSILRFYGMRQSGQFFLYIVRGHILSYHAVHVQTGGVVASVCSSPSVRTLPST